MCVGRCLIVGRGSTLLVACFWAGFPLPFSGSLTRWYQFFPYSKSIWLRNSIPLRISMGHGYCYWDCLMEWQDCVPLVGDMTALITSLMCCHARCLKVEILYKPKTWAFFPGFPYLRRMNGVCKFIDGFLRYLAEIDYQCTKAGLKRFWPSANTPFTKVTINFLSGQ